MSFEPELIVAIFASELILLLTLVINKESFRRFLAAINLTALTVFFVLTLLGSINFSSITLTIVALYQMINIGRVIENRMNLSYTRKQVYRTLVMLSLAVLLVPILTLIVESDVPLLRLMSFVCLVGGLIIFYTTRQNLSKSLIQKSRKSFSDSELPTVSVLIPARNEDDQLADCIHSLLASDYQKLEIIVLDDCSEDASSDIIKKFAHDGVRFVSGEAPKERWLAKNQAYETLAEAASGDYLIFGGVDIRVEPATIRRLVTYLLDNKLEMASVMPLKPRSTILATKLMTLRYYWEMALPRSIFGRPSTLSTFWIIEKEAYESCGGFASNANTVEPESLFARALKIKNSYAFLRADSNTPVLTEKSLEEQYNTAIRTLYPNLHRRIESVMTVSVAMLIAWFLPIVGLVYALGRRDYVSLAAYALAYFLASTSAALIARATGQKYWFVSILTFFYSVLQEVALLNLSMYKYEFSEVVWKGRNICYPIMHITPKLPDR